jgi:hypothetical protein
MVVGDRLREERFGCDGCEVRDELLLDLAFIHMS